MRIKKFIAGMLATAIMLPMMAINVFADEIPIDEDYFRDSAFREYIANNFDRDGNGSLSQYEIDRVDTIGLYNLEINNLSGIEVFTNLQYLTIRNTRVSVVNLFFNDKLEYLVLESNEALSYVNTNRNEELRYLNIYNSPLMTVVDVRDNPNLEKLYVSRCPLTTLYLENNDSLKYLYVSGTNLDTFDLTEVPNIEELDLYNNPINTLDLRPVPNLNYLNIGNTLITSIDLSLVPNLENLDVYGTSMTTLDITSNPKLRRLTIYNSDIREVAIYNCPHLVWVYTNTNHYPWFEHMQCESRCNEDNRADSIYYDLCQTFITQRPTATPTPTARPTNRPTAAPSAAPSARPTSQPTSRPTNRPTAVPTTAPTQRPQTPVSESGVSGFVERLYTIALGRNSDPAGKADWVNRVYTAGATGADIAQGFLFSPEFLGNPMSNEEFLDILYRVFFDRPGDAGGVEYWLSQMAGGMDKQTVIWGFINSTEWANVCLRFGIASGGNGVANITVEPSSEIIEFATRLYTTCLGREADQVGLMDWATQLANRQISGSTAAAGFFTSSEFLEANYSNEEYVNRLYRTFMGREADQGGFDYWMGRFAEGATREDVFLGFAGSNEWAEICSSYGILK